MPVLLQARNRQTDKHVDMDNLLETDKQTDIMDMDSLVAVFAMHATGWKQTNGHTYKQYCYRLETDIHTNSIATGWKQTDNGDLDILTSSSGQFSIVMGHPLHCSGSHAHWGLHPFSLELHSGVHFGDIPQHTRTEPVPAYRRNGLTRSHTFEVLIAILVCT